MSHAVCALDSLRSHCLISNWTWQMAISPDSTQVVHTVWPLCQHSATRGQIYCWPFTGSFIPLPVQAAKGAGQSSLALAAVGVIQQTHCCGIKQSGRNLKEGAGLWLPQQQLLPAPQATSTKELQPQDIKELCCHMSSRDTLVPLPLLWDLRVA